MFNLHFSVLLKAVRFILIIILALNNADVLGASVISRNPFVKYQEEGCTLLLPSKRLLAPVVTDEITQEELVPVQNTKNEKKNWFIHVSKNREIKVSCGRGNTLSIHDTFYYLRLTCVEGAKFRDDNGELVVLSNGIECSEPRKPTPVVFRNGSCSGKGTNFDVEFVVENPPRKFYSACMDEETSGTWYSSSYIDGESIANGLVESSGNRPDFRGQEFYPFAIKEAYKWENAFEHLSDLLGSEDLVNQYFPSQQFRFSRGHLFPNADAIKRFEKHATFYYINTVPQWQILNGGNWAKVEQDVRDFAAKLSKTFMVVTGSFRVTTLADANNNDVQIWLARDHTGKLRLPVPRFVWKVVHDPAASAAVAIVQVNNPWVLQPNTDILCNDLCNNLAWLRSSEFDSVRKGYTYCCDVNELRKMIPYVPQVEYTSVLGERHVADNEDDDDNDDDAEDDLESDSEEEDDDDDDDESEESNISSSDDDDDDDVSEDSRISSRDDEDDLPLTSINRNDNEKNKGGHQTNSETDKFMHDIAKLFSMIKIG